MDTLVVRDFDTAIDAYIASWTTGFRWESVNFSQETYLNIKLEGVQWDGSLDYKAAEFVIRLQKALLAAYNKQAEQKLRYNTRPMDDKGIRVVVKVEPGCSSLKVFFKGMWENMESKDKRNAIISIAAICAIPAGLVGWHYCDTRAETDKVTAELALERFKEEKRAEIELKVQERLQDEASRKEAMQTVGRAFDLAEQASAPMAYLASRMQPDDKISVNEVTFSSSDAKRIFKHIEEPDEAEEHRYFIDGEYIVSSINREQEEVTIRFKDKRRKFSLIWLNEPALEAFYKGCARRKSEKVLSPVSLQITAFFKGGVFQKGFVHGVGSPREGAITFTEAALDSARRQEELDSQDDE